MGCGSSIAGKYRHRKNDPEDEQHLQELQQEFPYQGCIEEVEKRGITLAQLQRTLAFAKERCHLWKDTATASRTSGKRLKENMLNLYHIADWVIKPATKSKACSFVELLTLQEQPPFWYLCHWWGERHVDFVRCVELHSEARSFRGNYWCCAYANRQHSLGSDIGTDPKESGFFRAMHLASFKVLLILNEFTPHDVAGKALERIWCSFEITMCLDLKSLPLDIANCHGSKARLISLPTEDANGLVTNPKHHFMCDGAKSATAVFPHEVMMAGLTAQLEKANASMPNDRIQILNSIVGRTQLMDPPLETHPKYAETNKRLHSLFALAFWRHCLSVTRLIPTKADETWQRMGEAARGDEWRKSLRVSLAGCEMADDKNVSFLLKSLPPNLKELDLDLSNTSISDATMRSLGTDIPQGVEVLSLDLSHCSEISDDGVAAFQKNLPPNLKQLKMELDSTKVSEKTKKAVQALMPDMQSWFSGLGQISSSSASLGRSQNSDAGSRRPRPVPR